MTQALKCDLAELEPERSIKLPKMAFLQFWSNRSCSPPSLTDIFKVQIAAQGRCLTSGQRPLRTPPMAS